MVETADRLNTTLASHRDDLGLIYLVGRLWASRWLIIGITIAAAAFAVYYTLSLRNVYRADAVLAPAADSIGGLSKLASGNLRGLANLVGIDVGQGPTEKPALALEVLRSRKFVTAFIAKRDILVPLMAAKKLDPATGELQLDPARYNARTGVWNYRNLNGERGRPSDWIVYETFKDLLEVETDELTGITTVSVDFYFPLLAAQWANWIVEDLNDQMRTIDAEAARANIRFLNDQITETRVVGLQEVFYRLIEEQTKNLMLAQIQKEYVFKIVDPAVVPEMKVAPKRALLCIAITVAGFCVALLLVLTLDFLRSAGLLRSRRAG